VAVEGSLGADLVGPAGFRFQFQQGKTSALVEGLKTGTGRFPPEGSFPGGIPVPGPQGFPQLLVPKEFIFPDPGAFY
jgi:hypothetical protein